ncbi:MAG: hypothetical protein IPK97_05630 [Ahniella sp.]|nr:hypothetical protein [Ahniella sp.]
MNGWLEAQGRRWPLVYRHLFVHRLELEPNEAIEQLLARRSNQGTLVLNPPAPHVEMKSTLARLSEVLDQPEWAAAIGLTAREIDVVADHVPWTRWLSDPGPDRTLATHRWLHEVLDTPESFVLKRSWSYGGRDVFFGRHARDPDKFEPARRLFPGVRDWRDLCGRAASDRQGGGFVVQRVVPVTRSAITFATPDQLRTVQATTDFSMFASFGVAASWTGVCRAAASDIVNIAGGGGVVPLLRQSVADEVASLRNDPA